MADTQEEIQSIADLDNATDYELKHSPNVRMVDQADSHVLFITIGLNGLTHVQEEGHYYEWIRVLVADELFYEKLFTPAETPGYSIEIPRGGATVRVHARCNLHGVWETIVQ